MGQVERTNKKYQRVATNLAKAIETYHVTEDKFDYLRRVAHQQ